MLQDDELSEKVGRQWDAIRSARNPAREQFIEKIRSFIRRTPGNAEAGQAVVAKVSSQ